MKRGFSRKSSDKGAHRYDGERFDRRCGEGARERDRDRPDAQVSEERPFVRPPRIDDEQGDDEKHDDGGHAERRIRR